MKKELIKYVLYLLLAVVILLAYWPAASFDFINFDDPVYVSKNPVINKGITWEGIQWAFTGVYAANWHPLTWLSHMADVSLFGMNPGKFHLVNVLFHVLNSILLFMVFERMTGALWRSFFVSALFALHPLHVESVAWISERKDVLSTLFWILTMLGYCWYVQRRSILRYLAVATFFGLGLLAKPMLVTLPFVLVLLDYWPLQRCKIPEGSPDARDGNSFRWKGEGGIVPLFLEKIPLFFMAFAACAETFFAQSAGGAVSNLERVSFASRIQNVILSYLRYLWKTIWPFNLAAFYPYPSRFNMTAIMASLMFLLAVSILVALLFRKKPYLSLGWFWYLGTLVPVIGFVQVGSQSMADRYTYVPLIGIFIMIVWGVSDLLSRMNHGPVAAGAGSILCFCSLVMITSAQVTTWKNTETVFSHAISATKDNYLAQNNLGVALYDKGKVDEAIRHYEQALRIKYSYVNAHCNLGAALAGKKQYAEAFKHYRECLRIKPGYSEAYYDMGVALSEMGHKDEAIKQYREVLKNYPHHENANNNLGFLLAGQGKFDEAIAHYEKALATNPDNTLARVNLADALLKKGRIDEALLQVDAALKIEPGNSKLYIKRAELRMKKDDPEGALTEYREALSHDPDSAQAIYGIAFILAHRGKLDEALNLMMKLSTARPGDPLVDYNIACLYSKQGKADEAVDYLKKAIGKGFKNWKTIMTDPDLENIRITESYKRNIAKSFRGQDS